MEENNNQNEVYSKKVRAGKRTYFFDVRATRGGDYYVTITESKKKYRDESEDSFYFEKHKIFLYKEDFEKFSEALQHTLSQIETGVFESDEDNNASDKSLNWE